MVTAVGFCFSYGQLQQKINGISRKFYGWYFEYTSAEVNMSNKFSILWI
jgi:hypothetical protein